MSYAEVVIEQEGVSQDTVCVCGNCNWFGPLGDTTPPEGAILYPGLEVPAGRCPECRALAYVRLY